MKVAIVGFGFMGRMHLRCWQDLPDAEITAICDANTNIAEQAKKAAGNIEGAAETFDLSGIRLYRDFDRMLSEQKLDAISLTLPSYLHADYSISALQAGLNVLCEKPMALTVSDCDRMIEAAQAGGKILQIGHCLRFWPEYAKAKELLSSEKCGKAFAATFQRLTAKPAWAWDNWVLEPQRSGGMPMDLHIHDTDFVQHLFGLPAAVRSFAAEDSSGRIVHIVTQYLYDDQKTITAEASWAATPSFGFEMSFNIMLQKATIVYDSTREPQFKICPADGDAFTPELEKTDGYALEIKHFADTIKRRNVPVVTTLQQSRDSVRIVQAEKESAAGSKLVRLD